ncbi:MAG TPA: thioredoxin [Thermoanaerobaculia bacterium]|nr:thioredoxin [Thermoanaerobaculia bacterium]
MGDPVVRCASCGQANRLPPLATGKKAVCGKCKEPLEALRLRSPVTLTDATFDATVVSGQSLLVDFWAAWCGPCRTIAPIIEAMARERDDVTFAKLNVDENPVSASRFRISGIPTMILFKDGVEKGRVVGGVGRRELEAAISRHLG